MDNIIAERKLILTQVDGTTVEIAVGILKPYLYTNSHGKELWMCTVYLQIPDSPWSIDFPGFDTLDAIQRAIEVLDKRLDELKERYGGRIAWLYKDELPDGGPLRCGALYGDQSWQLPEENREKDRAKWRALHAEWKAENPD